MINALLFLYLKFLYKLTHILILNNCKLEVNAQDLHLFITNLFIIVMASFLLSAHTLVRSYPRFIF
jgi:hypothetical protein